MLLFWCHRRKDDARARQTHGLSILDDVGLPYCREPQEPQHTVGHTIQDLQKIKKRVGNFRRHVILFNKAFKVIQSSIMIIINRLVEDTNKQV